MLLLQCEFDGFLWAHSHVLHNGCGFLGCQVMVDTLAVAEAEVALSRQQLGRARAMYNLARCLDLCALLSQIDLDPVLHPILSSALVASDFAATTSCR